MAAASCTKAGPCSVRRTLDTTGAMEWLGSHLSGFEMGTAGRWVKVWTALGCDVRRSWLGRIRNHSGCATAGLNPGSPSICQLPCMLVVALATQSVDAGSAQMSNAPSNKQAG